MKKFTALMICAALLLTSVTASAASGFYASGILGYSAHSSVDTKITTSYFGNTPTDETISKNFDLGSIWGLGLGYDFSVKDTLPLRVEFVWLRYNNKNTPSAPRDGITFNINSLETFMLNGWFVSKPATLQFYLGGGLGLAIINYEFKYDLEYWWIGGMWQHLSGEYKHSGMAGAFNLGLGLDWNITQHMALDFGYRYSWVNSRKLALTERSALSVETENTVISHNLLTAIKVKF